MFRQLENLMIPVVPCFIIRTLKVKASVLLLCLQESFMETCSASENSQTERNCPHLVEDDGKAPGWI